MRSGIEFIADWNMGYCRLMYYVVRASGSW